MSTTVLTSLSVDHGLVTGGTVVTATANGQALVLVAGTLIFRDQVDDAQDAAAAMILAGTHDGITFTYNDAANSLSATVTVGADRWFFDTSITMADPTTGKYRLNNTTFGSATQLAVSLYDMNGVNRNGAFIDLRAGDILTIQGYVSVPTWARYTIGTPVFNSTWYQIPLTYIASGPFPVAGMDTVLAFTPVVAAGSGFITAILDTDTVNLTVTGTTLSADVLTQMSIAAVSGGLKLVNDSAVPGNGFYYGTDSVGAKGWLAMPVSTVEAEWRYDATNNTMADPGASKFRTNTTLFSTATALAIATVANDGVDRTNLLKTLRTDDLVSLQDKSNSANWVRYRVTGATTPAASWFAVPVAVVEGGGTAPTNNTPVIFHFVAAGGGAGYSDPQAKDAMAAAFAAGTHSGITFSYNTTTDAMSATVTASGGTTILDGAAPPINTTGGVGNYYEDTLNGALYGPKSASGYGADQRITVAGSANQINTGEFGLRVRFGKAGRITRVRYNRNASCVAALTVRVWNDATFAKITEILDTQTGATGYFTVTLPAPGVYVAAGQTLLFSIGGAGFGPRNTTSQSVTDTADCAFLGFRLNATTDAYPNVDATVAGYVEPIFEPDNAWPISVRSIPQFTTLVGGQVPASGGGTANFLRADGTWTWPLPLTQLSITSDASGLKLSGDASAQSGQWYGTNAGVGTKGWYYTAGLPMMGVWTFDTSTVTTTSPAGGQFKFNSATASAVTEMAIHGTSHTQAGAYGYMGQLVALRPGDTVFFRASSSPTVWWRYRVAGAIIDGGTWVRVPLAYVSSSGAGVPSTLLVTYIALAQNDAIAPTNFIASVSDTTTIDLTVSLNNLTADVIDGSITDAKLRAAGPFSVVGRSGATSGTLADITATADGQFLRRGSAALGFSFIQGNDLPALNGFTDADWALDDRLPFYDTSAAANRDGATANLLGLARYEPGGRLTLTSGVPVTIADVTAAPTLYCTPYLHDSIILWDGTRWVLTQFAEKSLALSAVVRTSSLTGNTGAGSAVITSIVPNTTGLVVGDPVTGGTIAAGARIVSIDSSSAVTLSAIASTGAAAVPLTFYYSTYDVFGFLSAGTLALEMLAWTNNTTRATAVTVQDGRLCKSGDKTRLYLGTVRLTTTAATEDSVTQRFVFNAYNRVQRKLRKAEHTAVASWSYTTGAWRAANAQPLNRVAAVFGTAAEPAWIFAASGTNTTLANGRYVGCGIDTTTANSFDVSEVAGSAGPEVANSHLLYLPTAGYHEFNWIELGATGVTFEGGTTYGLYGWMWG